MTTSTTTTTGKDDEEEKKQQQQRNDGCGDRDEANIGDRGPKSREGQEVVQMMDSRPQSPQQPTGSDTDEPCHSSTTTASADHQSPAGSVNSANTHNSSSNSSSSSTRGIWFRRRLFSGWGGGTATTSPLATASTGHPSNGDVETYSPPRTRSSEDCTDTGNEEEKENYAGVVLLPNTSLLDAVTDDDDENEKEEYYDSNDEQAVETVLEECAVADTKVDGGEDEDDNNSSSSNNNNSAEQQHQQSPTKAILDRRASDFSSDNSGLRLDDEESPRDGVESEETSSDGIVRDALLLPTLLSMTEDVQQRERELQQMQHRHPAYNSLEEAANRLAFERMENTGRDVADTPASGEEQGNVKDNRLPPEDETYEEEKKVEDDDSTADLLKCPPVPTSPGKTSKVAIRDVSDIVTATPPNSPQECFGSDDNNEDKQKASSPYSRSDCTVATAPTTSPPLSCRSTPNHATLDDQPPTEANYDMPSMSQIGGSRSEDTAAASTCHSKSDKRKRMSTLIRVDLWSRESVVVESALRYIHAEATANDGNARSTIARTGGLLAIVSAMENHLSVASVQIQACRCLETLALDADNEMAIGEVGGIEAVLLGMIQHFDDESVLESAWAALWNLSCCSSAESLMSAVDSLGGMDVLVQCMTRHSTSAPVQANACGTLANLCIQQEARIAALVEAGGLVAIASALQQHWEHPDVRKEAGYALTSMLGP